MRRWSAALAIVLGGCCGSDEVDPDGAEGGGTVELEACDHLEFQDRLSSAPEHRPSGQCVNIPLAVHDIDRVNCVIIEERNPGPPCDEQVGRDPVPPEHEQLLKLVQAPFPDPEAVYCELRQLEGADNLACQSDKNSITPGFCYLRSDVEPIIGDEQIVAACPDRRLLRLAGDAGQYDGVLHVFCDIATASCD